MVLPLDLPTADYHFHKAALSAGATFASYLFAASSYFTPPSLDQQISLCLIDLPCGQASFKLVDALLTEAVYFGIAGVCIPLTPVAQMRTRAHAHTNKRTSDAEDSASGFLPRHWRFLSPFSSLTRLYATIKPTVHHHCPHSASGGLHDPK